MKQIQLYKLILLFILFYFLVQSCTKRESINNSVNKKKDSISIWIKSAKNKAFSLDERISFLSKAYQKTKQYNENDLKIGYLSSIAYRYYKLDDIDTFMKLNEETLQLAVKLKDTFYIADAYWSYADFYYNKNNYDQAYYYFDKAYNYFNSVNDKLKAARMLYTMAFIKGRYRDYTGSEVLLIEAIKKFKDLEDFRRLYDSYNDLANLQNDIQEYDRSLFYHQKALSYINKLKDKKRYYNASLNNIGLTYLKKGVFKQALKYFNDALENNYDRETYARTIDNRAISKLGLNDTTNVKKELQLSLSIRDSINNKAGITNAKISISKYYIYIKDTVQAIQYAKEANVLAYEIKNGVDYLESLDLLSDLEPQNAKKYLDRYIQYDDSLKTVERKTIDKFTRIEFQTDEYIDDNKLLSEQKLWITGSGISVVLILSLIYFLKVQRSKNEKLVLESEQQKANEQVYLLTLKQQATLEEEKVLERNRISQELHDGILGRLFGTRMGLGFLDLEGGETSKEQHQAFLDELQDIEKEIRDVSHKLNNNFSSSEINFTTIIDQLLKDKSQLGGFQTELNLDKSISWNGINEIIKVNVYRIVQESLQNIIKHAEAKHVTLDLSSDGKQLGLVLIDDGVGFSVKKAKKGIGLKNIQSRVKKLKGNLEIKSATNKGTTLHIKIPIQ